MAFKGRHSPIRCDKGKPGRRPPSQSPDFFPPRDFSYHPLAGWIHPRQIIFDTGLPLPGIYNLGSMIYSGEDLPLGKIRDSLTIQCLVMAINDFLRPLKNSRERWSELDIDDIIGLRVCRHNISIWLVEFNPQRSRFHRQVERVIQIADEGDGGNQGSGDEGAGVVSALMFNELAADLNELSLPGVHIASDYQMSVGVVDRGGFDRPGEFSSGEATHAMILSRIISDPGVVTPVACPMVESYAQTATVFDMICALSNRCILDTVQVINISQGFYARDPHPVLHKVLNSIDKPIVCSAGNDGQDNDALPHWPSNFYLEIDKLISVASLTSTGQFVVRGAGNRSNYGLQNVTLAARGQWGRLYGTSYAAAWMSRMIATAFSLESRTDLNLDYVQQALTPHFSISRRASDRTHTKLRFMT